MSDAKAVAVIGIIPKLVWPVVALVLAGFFSGSIKGAIDNATRGGGGGTVTLGIVKIEFPKKSDIPEPPEDIGPILTELTPSMIRWITVHEGLHPLDICNRDNQNEFKSNSVSSQLAKRELITFATELDQKDCPPKLGSHTTFTPLYYEVRSYLISVLTSLKFKKTG
jgi:hypothetical protein